MLRKLIFFVSDVLVCKTGWMMRAPTSQIWVLGKHGQAWPSLLSVTDWPHWMTRAKLRPFGDVHFDCKILLANSTMVWHTVYRNNKQYTLIIHNISCFFFFFLSTHSLSEMPNLASVLWDTGIITWFCIRRVASYLGCMSVKFGPYFWFALGWFWTFWLLTATSIQKRNAVRWD